MKTILRTLPFFLATCLILTPPALGSNSTGSITGKIKNKEGGGLLGAVITILKQEQAGGTISFTRSDRNGLYSIANISPGSYSFQISREGYQPVTHPPVKIEPGKTTTLNIVLQEFLAFVVADEDPRNWDLKTVIRSTSDRRLIFRGLPAGPGESVTALEREGLSNPGSFSRGGSVNVASSASLSNENYSVLPSYGRNGIVSNFAFAEPVGEHSRMIFAGQLNSGYDSLWRVRNVYNYRPEAGRDLRFSISYGRLSLNAPSPGSVSRPTQFFTQDQAVLRESGARTLGFGFEARDKISDSIAVEYGFDYSRITLGTTKSVFSPMVRLIITPAGSWTILAERTSRRISENNTAILPDGELVNLMEPTYIAKIDGELYSSQFKHTEISISRPLLGETSMGIGVYEDHIEGPGTPFLIQTNSYIKPRMAQLTEDQASQRGVRVTMSRRFLDFLDGSVAYVRGTGTALTGMDDQLAGEVLARDILKYMHRQYYHALTSQLNATLAKTKTNFTTIVRWYPGSTITPIDLFSDRYDTMTKGVNFFVRQAIPLPEFMATAGRWEALVDVRNLLDQGKDRFRATDGDLFVTRNPRSFRFGLNLNFY